MARTQRKPDPAAEQNPVDPAPEKQNDQQDPAEVEADARAKAEAEAKASGDAKAKADKVAKAAAEVDKLVEHLKSTGTGTHHLQFVAACDNCEQAVLRLKARGLVVTAKKAEKFLADAKGD